jgi:hypothetical protein
MTCLENYYWDLWCPIAVPRPPELLARPVLAILAIARLATRCQNLCSQSRTAGNKWNVPVSNQIARFVGSNQTTTAILLN